MGGGEGRMGVGVGVGDKSSQASRSLKGKTCGRCCGHGRPRAPPSPHAPHPGRLGACHGAGGDGCAVRAPYGGARTEEQGCPRALKRGQRPGCHPAAGSAPCVLAPGCARPAPPNRSRRQLGNKRRLAPGSIPDFGFGRWCVLAACARREAGSRMLYRRCNVSISNSRSRKGVRQGTLCGNAAVAGRKPSYGIIYC